MRARSAFTDASAAAATASATPAWICASAACVVSGAKLASTWPRLTMSPTLTCTALRRRPFASAPMLASCHADTVPLAVRRCGSSLRDGVSAVTVSAGLSGSGAFAADEARTLFVTTAAPRSVAPSATRTMV